MKKFIGKTRATMRNYLRQVMDTSHRHMSRGAEYINKMISWAHNDNWRRKEKKK